MPDWFPPILTQPVVTVPLRIALMVVAALVLRLILHRMVDRVAQRAITRAPRVTNRAAQVLLDATTVPAARREQRISALVSMAKSAITLVIFLIAATMVLAELGFPITSIVAGTSVVAVALAFGVQSIVKDLISGVFLLVEDQFGVGDYVDMEKASGTVEEIGLRVTQLRADDGTVWYVRNGEVLAVANYSQGGPGRPPASTEPATS